MSLPIFLLHLYLGRIWSNALTFLWGSLIEHGGLRHYIVSHFLTLHPNFVLWHFFYVLLFDRPLFLADVLWDRKRGPPSHVLNSYSPTSLYLCLSVITLLPWSWEVIVKVSSNSHLWKMQSGLLWYQRDCLFIHLIFNFFSNLLFWVCLPFHIFYNKVQKIWFFSYWIFETQYYWAILQSITDFEIGETILLGLTWTEPWDCFLLYLPYMMLLQCGAHITTHL